MKEIKTGTAAVFSLRGFQLSIRVTDEHSEVKCPSAVLIISIALVFLLY